MSVGGIARGGLFLFVGLVTAAVLAYVYWFLISLISGPEVVGIASSIVSLSTLVSGIATLGVPLGVQRFLGRAYSHKKVKSVNVFFWSSFVFVLALCLLSATIIWCIAFTNMPFTGFSSIMLFLTGFIVILSFSGSIVALFVSTTRTEYIPISTLVSSIVMLCSGVYLVHLGFGWFGAVTGIILYNVALELLMLFFAWRELKRIGGVKIRGSLRALQQSLRAGFPSWLPYVITLLGQQLSLLTVFQFQGSYQAGVYYIAYAIFSILYMLPSSFMSILFPILSGTTGGGREIAWKVLKLCLALTCPLTAFLMIYSAFPLSIIGQEYIKAALTLTLLASCTIPLTFISAVTNLVYASGSYGKVLGIGLLTNVPRVVLYFLFVPIYGGFGAALSFLVGTLPGLVAAIYVSRIANFKVSRRKIVAAIAAPFVGALVSFLIGLDWLLGGTVILLSSLFVYGRLGVVERRDLTDIGRAFASEKTIAKAGERLHWLLKIIYGE